MSSTSHPPVPLGRAYPYQEQDEDARRAAVVQTIKQLEAQHWAHVIAYEQNDHEVHVLTGQRDGETPRLVTKAAALGEYRVSQRQIIRAHLLRIERELATLRARFAEYLTPPEPSEPTEEAPDAERGECASDTSLGEKDG